MLADALYADENSSTEMAYVVETYFSLPDQPFPFWREPGWLDITEWVQFTFPELGVAEQGTEEMYIAEGLENLQVLLQSATAPESWINFGIWLYEHYDDADEINAARAGDFSTLCAYCFESRDLYITYYYNWLIQRGYTENEIRNWCAFYADDDCNRLGMTAKEKAIAIRDCSPSKKLEDIGKVKDAI